MTSWQPIPSIITVSLLVLPCPPRLPATCLSHASLLPAPLSVDLAPLCSQNGYSHLNASTDQTYWFNSAWHAGVASLLCCCLSSPLLTPLPTSVCGTAPEYCSPQGYDVFQRVGPAVQFFGGQPDCNQANPECTNILTGEPECCTRDCEILGYGTPIFSMQDESNPVTGGLRIQHIAAPPTFDDIFSCPTDPKTGAPRSRSLTYLLNCDQSAIFAPKITSVLEVSECTYEFQISTRYACGCAPQCDGKTCGPNGCGGFCGSNGMGGNCPDGQSCGDDQVCRSPAPANSNKPNGKYQYTGGDIAGALFGGILLALVLLAIGYFLFSKGYCAAAYAAVTGAGRRGFKKMPPGAAGKDGATASAAASDSTSSSYNSMGAGAKASSSYGSSSL